ncbi:MAG: hypothetical protein AAF485_30945, partial [Chloroflexota bacterium]
TFLEGLFLNVLSPNPYLAWGSILGPIVIKAWNQSPTQAIAYVVTFYATFVVGLSFLVITFDRVGQINPKAPQIILSIAAMGLVFLGFFQIWLGVSGLFV